MVEETDEAWHIGLDPKKVKQGLQKYYNSARNNNSIGIEMCCKKRNGEWIIEEATIENTLALACMISRKWGIDSSHWVRHFDCTRKRCPEPFVRNEQAWKDFKKKLEGLMMAYETEQTTEAEKEETIKEFYNLDQNTIQFMRYYRYGQPLIDKLYYRARTSKNQETPEKTGEA